MATPWQGLGRRATEAGFKREGFLDLDGSMLVENIHRPGSDVKESI